MSNDLSNIHTFYSTNEWIHFWLIHLNEIRIKPTQNIELYIRCIPYRDFIIIFLKSNHDGYCYNYNEYFCFFEVSKWLRIYVFFMKKVNLHVHVFMFLSADWFIKILFFKRIAFNVQFYLILWMKLMIFFEDIFLRTCIQLCYTKSNGQYSLWFWKFENQIKN